LAPDFQLSSQFGEYSVSFRSTAAGQLEITRRFRIPVQVIPAERFREFSRFAARIDEAERQRLNLERVAHTAQR
jgi:hypothetical protein